MNSRSTPEPGERSEPNAATGPPTTPYVGAFAQMFGVWYPRDYVVAALDAAQGPPAVQALLAAGFGRDAIYLRDSAEVRAVREQISEGRSPIRRSAAKVARAVTDVGVMAQEYFDEADEGASLLIVHCPEPKLVEDARRVLRAHGGRQIRFYGATSIADLH
jgi:hypothetical protein